MSDTPRVEFDKVLYVRVDTTLLKGLDKMAKDECRKTPSRKVTRSDIARDILLAEVKRIKRRK